MADKPQQPDDSARREFLLRSAGTLAVAGTVGAAAQAAAQSAQPASQSMTHDAFALRTITAGIQVSAATAEADLASAGVFLNRARQIMEDDGFTVQTTRITTQPHAFYLRDLNSDKFERTVAGLKAAAGSSSLAIGPGLTDDRNDEAAVEKAVLAASAGVNSTIVIGAAHTGVHFHAIAAAAQVIETLARIDPMKNFAFGSIASVPPGVPFFPGGYHGGGVNSFAIGPEGASLFMQVCREAGDLTKAGPLLIDAYTRELKHVETSALKIARDTGWQFNGIDPTPAQWGEISIGSAVESLIKAPFGSPGTLAACRVLTHAIKNVDVKAIGYRGLFLPPMEDKTLAQRAYDYFGLSSLLSFSAVCGTGLDAVAIPGDTTLAELRRILADVATLAVQLNKPLTARLMPVPGKQAGELTDTMGRLFRMKPLSVR